jgi:predicted O-methyltransferase YrrM
MPRGPHSSYPDRAMTRWRETFRKRLEKYAAGESLLRARSELLLPHAILKGRDYWPGMREPFNGQRGRMRAMRALIDEFDPDALLETGTFIGSTTRFLCGNGLPVYTAEIKRRYWFLARLRLGWDSELSAFVGDSRDMLRQLSVTRHFDRPLAYLDAHWGANLPLASEIALLCESWKETVIVVDDFRVDGDGGYGYDEYNGRALSLSDVALPAGITAAFPAMPSHAETGAKRGTLYAASGPEATQALNRLIDRNVLRPTTGDSRSA